MTFAQFIDQSWNDHATRTAEVAERLRQAAAAAAPEQIASLVPLITHVYGEHLGAWDEGIQLLSGLQAVTESAEDRQSLLRNITALRLAAGQANDAADLMVSDRIRVLCVAGSALAGQGQAERAGKWLDEALTLAESLIHSDPANRALAVTGNNLAAALEEKKGRTPVETRLMLTAARAGLKYWLRAGQWPQHQAAHYRLSKSLFSAGEQAGAVEAAMSCLALCKANEAGPFDMFWAHEALATSTRSFKPAAYLENLRAMRDFYERMPDGEKSYCTARLQELDSQAVQA